MKNSQLRKILDDPNLRSSKSDKQVINDSSFSISQNILLIYIRKKRRDTGDACGILVSSHI